MSSSSKLYRENKCIRERQVRGDSQQSNLASHGDEGLFAEGVVKEDVQQINSTMIKDEIVQASEETVKKQWLDILSKMAASKKEMFTEEMCKMKPMISKGHTKHVAYNFKESGEGWVLGKLYCKSIGLKRRNFNFECDFIGKDRQDYFLDYNLYFHRNLSDEENGPSEACNMAWVIFGKSDVKKGKAKKGSRKRKAPEPIADNDAAVADVCTAVESDAAEESDNDADDDIA